MADNRPADQLSIEELERLLAEKKRQQRMGRLYRMQKSGRLIDVGQSSGVTSAENLPKIEVPEPPPSTRITRAQAAPVATSDDSTGCLQNIVLLIEILVIIAFVFLLIVSFRTVINLQQETNQFRSFNDEVANSQVLQVEPTPQLRIDQVVLPGGHTPPTELEGGQFNIEEIPVHLRSLVSEQALQPSEASQLPPTADTPLRLVIPKIGVDREILQGVDWETLKLGIGQMQNGNLPNGTGNVVLAGHNDIYGEVFKDLDQLEAGDELQIHTQSGVYQYRVAGWEIVLPTAVHVLEQGDSSGVILISGYPYLEDTHRIIVYANQPGASASDQAEATENE